MKLALIIAVYKRHDLERIVLNNFKRQSEKFGFEIIIAGSEGEVSKELANGCHYVEVDNFPLSNKHNSMLEVAKKLEVDGVVLMGSDDIVNDAFWSNIYKFKSTDKDVKGLTDLYFYSTKSKQIGYFVGYKNSTQTAGAGRFFSKYVLEKANWKLWSDSLNVGLDSDCTARLTELGIKDKSYTMLKSKAILIDVKHTISITKKEILSNCEDAIFEEVFSTIDKETTQKIINLEYIKPETFKLDYSKKFNVMSTGKFKDLGVKGTIIELSGENATVLINKGFATLCQ